MNKIILFLGMLLLSACAMKPLNSSNPLTNGVTQGNAGEITCAGGQVFTLGDYLTINLPTDNMFDTNSDELLPQAFPVLDRVAVILKHYPNNNIIIAGNTSGFYTEKLDNQLSRDRARQVASYLWSKGINNFQGESIDDRKLTFVGYGNYFPIANDIHADSIRLNSHIQITSYPSIDQLVIENKCAAFNNIGGLGRNQESLCKPRKP